MKKYEDIKTAICPKCGQEYTGRPALSRADNKTTYVGGGASDRT